MSLATNIKEFADVLHNVYAQQLSSINGTDIASEAVLPLAIPKTVVIQEACVYLAKSFGSGIIYFLSFQWLRDFSYFPLLSPEGQKEASSFADTFLSEPGSYLFSFSKNGVSFFGEKASTLQNEPFTSFLKMDGLLAGFVNSFFFSLPFSLPHLITLRRMFSQGVAAAAASVLGTVAAHSLLLAGVLYGIRFLIVPYYSLQPLTFLIGSVAIAIVITEFVKEKRVYLVPLTHYPSLIRIGVLNFVVALCESATVFHDLHHLTLNEQTSYLQLYESQSALDSFLVHTAYLLTFVLGHAFLSLVFCYLILKGNEKLCSLTGWTLPKSARRINKALLIVLVTLTFSGFPYYGLDYLFTKSAGFLPEDPAYINTIFSPTQVRSRNRHFKSRAPATKNSKTPLELDLNYFDRGMYLNAPREEKVTIDPYKAPFQEKDDTSVTYDPALTFEELNYRGESAWLMRHERARRLPDEQDSKKESVFQKPKTHFKELRLKQDKEQAEAALREGSQIGSVSEWKEGGVPGEALPLYSEDFGTNGIALPRLKKGEGNTFGEGMREEQNPDIVAHTYGEGLLKELAFEKEIASNYEKSFTSPFKEESDGTPPDLLPVENIIKKRYRLNPVYRALLQTDVDSFIARQPADYKITQNQEASLFKKRQLLEKYYNSVRYYTPIESVGFTNLHGAQFKNLGVSNARANPRFATVVQSPVSKKDSPLGTPTASEAELSLQDIALQHRKGETQKSLTKPSYQPYKSKAEIPFTKSFVETAYHQQFKGTLNTVKRFFKLTLDEQQNPNKNRILSYDQPLYKKRLSHKENYHPSLHEELDLEKVFPFIEESNSAPIYAGWDEKARRFVITNRFNFVEQ